MIEKTNGSRVAQISQTADGFLCYVGFAGTPGCPGEETIPARFFAGTCSREYKHYKAAVKAADRFLAE